MTTTPPLTFSAEQEELRTSVRRFLQQRQPLARTRELADAGEPLDRPVWAQMAGQLGLQGLTLPEEFGGSGFGAVEACVVFEELGRELACSPFFSTVGLAVPALLAAADDAANKDHLPGIADGSTVATVALYSGDGRDSALVAGQTAGGWELTGSAGFVTDAGAADLVLAFAETLDGSALFAVEAGALEISPMKALDLTRPLARLRFDHTPARLTGAVGDGGVIRQTVLDAAATALACEHLGAARHCLELAVDYAKTRVQFERPIGSFQAVKHKAADLLVEVESAASAAYYASWSLAGGSSEFPQAAAIAAAYVPEVLFKVAAGAIQILGGIGYTWEHDAHLFFRRAKSAQLLFGSTNSHLDRLASLGGY